MRKSLVCLWLCFASVLASGGCDDLNEPPADMSDLAAQGQDCVAHVYLLRGLWDVFSRGLNVFQSELAGAGVPATVMSGPDWPQLADEIRARAADGTLPHPLVLVGHSYGSDEAVELAKQLQPDGIQIELLMLIDATDPPEIPANVDAVLHLYIPSALGQDFPDGFAGNPVVAEPGNDHTQIVNEIVNVANFGPDARRITHFNIEASPLIHRAIAEQIIAYCNTGKFEH